MGYGKRMMVMSLAKLAKLLLLALWPLGSGMAAEAVGTPEEILVVGRQPGPPLWKVSKGENVLWIFPYLQWVPQDMHWDSERVARVIAQSQEALGLPAIDMKYAPSLVLNPINIVRGTRLMNRLDRYPDGRTLKDDLPSELYARYAAVQARYFPGERAYAFMRPREVGGRMMHIVREREALVDGGDILRTIRRHVRRNGAVRHTAVSVEVNIDDSYREYAQRLEALAVSFPPELEHACFEQQVRHVEEIDTMKRLANDWAAGYIDEFRDVDLYDVSLMLNELSACDELLSGSSSPERENMARTNARLNQEWLDAAENALATNTSTFAILPINELLADGGLLRQLEARGYEILEP